MPGLYLIALLVSLAGVVVLDLRFGGALRTSPGRTIAASAIGTVFFLLWDAAGIALGVFVKGESPLLVGVDLAPELPLEEPVFLFFLCYLAATSWVGARRILDGRRRAQAGTKP